MTKTRWGWVAAAFFILILAASCGKTTPATTSNDLEMIKARLEAGAYSEALDMLEDFVQGDSNNAEAQFLLGLAYFNTGAYEKARQAFENTLELDPTRAGAVHHNLGALAIQMDDLNTAIQEFQAALDVEPDDPDTHYQLGAVYLMLALPANTPIPDETMLAQAQAEFERALEIEPGKPEVLVGIGNIYLLKNQFKEAAEVLQQAVDAAPEMPEALFALGRAHFLAGDQDAARTVLERFLETDPPAVWAQQAQDMIASLP
ncbi:MAG: tetratricopeptide repeat protein [Anaerolineae bacterium]|nr:tetratricopeptide repeat protein [Anaerolineae bacterium]